MKDNKDILVSIVIPVYNAEIYLKKCINSILTQTYKNIQIILVNDGSTDNSAKICEDFLKKDNRIKLINKTNGGVSSARNMGIYNCEGDYIVFVDSDDWIDSRHIEDLVNPIFIEDYDLVVCNYSIVNENKCNKNSSYKQMNNYINKDFYNLRYLFNSPCLCLYKKRIIKDNSIIFNTISNFGEDQEFNIKYCMYAKTYFYNEKFSYYYYKKKGETLSKRRNYIDWENFLTRLDLERIYIEKRFVPKKDEILAEHALIGMFHFYQLNDYNNSFKSFKNRLIILEEKYIFMYFSDNFKFNLILKLLRFKQYYLIYILFRIKYMLKNN